ncbi:MULTISPECIES: hypothetical protein [Xanthomonas]|uniref:hypothetical protein n=1 Tax=Xanthomonas TaxID=338 RepID=UPI00030FD1F8|nr:hypothetical protein [Xanthomonas citri]MDS0759402.1 hypothetical protein [Xanthomonas citri pv. punicae]MDS0763177.1 hypothetical protein [Xanthomonas citri pv. punicae]MDS0797948.1 hypothetical protein [Xanthomonas citri pv. punicae]MDS0830583.1 hypothetical protein [Xanthomonas citri pv. punicae]MDS0834391.1 hypothetical protein [Xanthomonas citri pv. punicae]
MEQQAGVHTEPGLQVGMHIGERLASTGTMGPLTDGSAWRDGCETEGNHLITRGGSFAASRQLLHGAARGNANRTNAAAWAKASALQKTSAPAPQAYEPMPMQDSWRRWKRRSGVNANGVRERQCGEWGAARFRASLGAKGCDWRRFLGLLAVDNGS